MADIVCNERNDQARHPDCEALLECVFIDNIRWTMIILVLSMHGPADTPTVRSGTGY